MYRRTCLLLLSAPALLQACAPAPLYTSSGLHAGAVTLGEIPRDARGEPVWAAIRPAPAIRQAGDGLPSAPADVQEGDAEEFPRRPIEE